MKTEREQPPIVILLSGPIGGGKTLASQIITDTLNAHKVDSATISLAAPIKELAKTLFGIDPGTPRKEREWTVDFRTGTCPITPNGEWTPRAIWQFLGTNVGRAICPNIWVNRWIDMVNYTCDPLRDRPPHTIICDDVRFPNEVQRIKEAFPRAFLIYIVRPGRNVLQHTHASETHGDWLISQADAVFVAHNKKELTLVIEEWLPHNVVHQLFDN